ncbi:unnamed protein product [Leptidea sinapis]|uniref:Uncharacterized protein n=1 Tax=Leptidea sinapis TaxID=189913 RepID=A0A5E4PVG3_9NEOP|nr:unnamed protein product [Leptidea sinapis]
MTWVSSLDGYVAGEDYPAFEEVPKGLSFTCDDKIPGYYADPETMCQLQLPKKTYNRLSQINV